MTRLNIVVKDPKRAAEFKGNVVFGLQRGVSDFKEGDPNIAVGMRADVKPEVEEGEEPAFEVNVELSGQFKVDYSEFAFEDLPRWSLVNAPMLLIPYVREQVYGLALRAGIKGLFLPLIVSQPAKAAPQIAENK